MSALHLCPCHRCNELARHYLDVLGKLTHPDASPDPVSALGQVAVDLAQIVRLGGASVHCSDPVHSLPPNVTHPPKEV